MPAIDPVPGVLSSYLRMVRSVVTTRRRGAISAELVRTTRERITAARSTIAPWQRRRIAGGSASPGDGLPDGCAAGDADVLVERVRDLVERGVLPRQLVERVWAGKGTGVSCLVCDKPIDPMEVEFEVEGIHLHRPCHSAWIRVLSSRV